MKCVIGIDGGGTKSLLRMVDMERTVLYETLGGGLNLCSTGKQQVKKIWNKLCRVLFLMFLVHR